MKINDFSYRYLDVDNVIEDIFWGEEKCVTCTNDRFDVRK
jgi:hypothetical protein